MAFDMEYKNTVFLIAPVQFSVVRIVILFIQFSNTVQNMSYFVMYMFFFLLISRNSIDCAVLRDFWSISRNREIPEGLFVGP